MEPSSSDSEGSGDEAAVVVRARFEDVDRGVNFEEQPRASLLPKANEAASAPATVPGSGRGLTAHVSVPATRPELRVAAASANEPRAMDRMDGLGHFKAIRELWAKR